MSNIRRSVSRVALSPQEAFKGKRMVYHPGTLWQSRLDRGSLFWFSPRAQSFWNDYPDVSQMNATLHDATCRNGPVK